MTVPTREQEIAQHVWWWHAGGAGSGCYICTRCGLAKVNRDDFGARSTPEPSEHCPADLAYLLQVVAGLREQLATREPFSWEEVYALRTVAYIMGDLAEQKVVPSDYLATLNAVADKMRATIPGDAPKIPWAISIQGEGSLRAWLDKLRASPVVGERSSTDQ